MAIDDVVPTTAAAPSGASDALMSNDALLAEMDELGDELPSAPAEKAKPKEKVSEEPAEPVEDDTASDGAVADADGDAVPDEDADPEAEEPADDDPAADPAPEDKPDPVAARRIDAIQKAEKQSKERLDQQRAEAERLIERRRSEIEAEWKPKLEAYEKHQKLLERATVDPVSFANEQKWDRETKLYWAEQMFLEAKGADDPKYAAQRTQRLREREAHSKTSDLERQLRETNERLERFEQDRRDEAYLGTVVASAGDDHPHVASLLKTMPDATKARARMVRDELKKQTGTEPSAAEVLKILEENEAAYLKALGYEPRKAPAKTKPVVKTDTKTKATDAGERKTAKTAKNGSTKPSPNAPPPDRDQLLKELEDLDRN